MGQIDLGRGLWQPIPPLQFHEIFTLVKRGHFRLEGDLHPFMANLLYMKDVLTAPRQKQQSPTLGSAETTNRPIIEPIIGRYIHLDLGGRDNRIYYEKAGQVFRWYACTRLRPTGASTVIL